MLLADSAFPTCGLDGKIVRGRKNNEAGDIDDGAVLGALDIITQRYMPSERQSAEWGIRTIKDPFGILRKSLPADARKRFVLLSTCAHLLNLRTRMVRLNQTRTVYASKAEKVQPWILQLAAEYGS